MKHKFSISNKASNVGQTNTIISLEKNEYSCINSLDLKAEHIPSVIF